MRTVIFPVSAVLVRLTIPAIGLALFGLLGILYVDQPDRYQSIMLALIKLPIWRPFVDWEWVTSAVKCWNEGVNVYISNPCDRFFPRGVGFNYSPLWLRVTFLRFADGRTNLFGITIGALFFLSLALLPPPRTKLDFWIRLLATMSSATALALERANTDLVMFLMITVGVCALALRLPFRIAGYSLITLAGLLKFYPMVALIVTLRERPAAIAIVYLAAGAALTALAFSYYDELVWMAGNLPSASYYTLQFSAKDLPGALGISVARVMRKVLQQDVIVAETFGELMYTCSLVLLLVQALAIAIWFGRRWDLRSAVARLPAREADFLVVGAALICGCFFAGHSVIYKGIFLLFAVPGLLALSHESPLLQSRRAFRGTCLAVVFVLWFVFIEWCIAVPGLGRQPPYLQLDGLSSPVGYVAWLCNELAWWWIVIVLLAVLGAFVLNSKLGAMVTQVLPLAASLRADRSGVAEP